MYQQRSGRLRSITSNTPVTSSSDSESSKTPRTTRRPNPMPSANGSHNGMAASAVPAASDFVNR